MQMSGRQKLDSMKAWYGMKAPCMSKEQYKLHDVHVVKDCNAL